MTETTCAVCGEPIEEADVALCGVCDRPFHLNRRNDDEGKDCGVVWIDEQYLALRFACHDCAPSGPSEAEPPIGAGH